jgi:hypothetical protein
VSIPSFPTLPAAFELPSVTAAMELSNTLRPDWHCWVESGLDGTFVLVFAPERISELDRLLSAVESWVAGQECLAIRFRLDGRVYIMQRGGCVEAPNPDRGRPAEDSTDRS